MSRTRTIGYWASTGLLAAGLGASGLAKLAAGAEMVEGMTHLGYPTYLLPILGSWYLAAALALLVPRLPLLKEWAYAGVAFAMSGAVISHVVVGDPIGQSAPAVVFLALMSASYWLRPASRRVATPQTSAGAVKTRAV
ncbi:MAG: DoxX family protein [Myxococcota bacterium]